jgi:hypothetical protein
MMQDPEVLGLQRQRQLANLLTGQAFNAPQGQMISGHYVKPSGLQQALPMINAAIGGLTNANLDTKQTELAAALRGKEMQAAQQYATATTPQARMAAAMSPYAPQMIKTAFAERMKPQKVGEGETIYSEDFGTGQFAPMVQGGPKYRAPLHFDVGNAIEVRDPYDPTKVLQRIPKNMSPESAARLADEGIGGYSGVSKTAMPTINQGSPILAKPPAQTTMPAAGVNPFADYNNSIVPPAGLPPKDARKYMAEANTPLTGDASARVQGGLDTIDAIDSYRKILTDYSKLSSLNPTQRANLEAAYYTMTLKSKEANKLGVLNGRDQEILEKLAPNPNDIKSLLVTNSVLSEQALKQRNLITGFTVNSYGEQRKKIPDYVINKIQPLKTEIIPIQAGKIERPSMIDETTWGFMTPQEKALFRKQ